MRGEALLNFVRAQPCAACGIRYQVEAHHIISRGAGGGDDAWNVIPLCAPHHTGNGVGHAWHRGRLSFIENYPSVKKALVKIGWEFNGDRLFHAENLLKNRLR